MDLDGDGHRDVITGSWPGELYFFAGREDGTFAKGETIKGADGEAYSWSASVPYATDWDGDGDLDLVVGDIDGHVHFIPNSSGDKTLKLGESTTLKAGENEIKVPGGDSGPVVADWNGDGRHDLLVGCGNGEVHLYTNTAAEGAPTLAAAEQLVAPSKSYPGREPGDGDCSPCGSRTKIAVADYNKDGKLDLLVGDFTMTKPEKKELTEEQKKRLTELEQKQSDVMPKYMEVMMAGQKKIFEELGITDPQNVPADKQEAVMKAFQEFAESPEVKGLMEELQSITKELGELQGQARPGGNVWVFARA